MIDEEIAKELLENQQKEIRAYDQKAGYYIASNSGLFVIALFTLCIFTMFHGKNEDITQFSCHWLWLFILTIVYVLTFLLSSACCLLVLFARIYKSDSSIKTVTNPHSFEMDDFESTLKETEKNMEEIREYHIKSNAKILKQKHRWANFIPWLSIPMGITLLALMVLLFVF